MAGIPIQVLILEDRAADAELMVRELKKAGYDPDWQRVETERDFSMRLVPSIDLIIADFHLPGFDAFRALEILKTSKLDAPLIMVSGSLVDEQAVECLKHGATDYLLKDRLARLGPATEHALANRHDRRARIAVEGELRRSEQQMRGVMTTIEDMVFSLSLPDYQLLYMNRAGERIFGRRVEEFQADRQLWLKCVHAEDRSRMLDDQQAAIRWGTSESEFRIVHPDGSTRQVISRVWSAFGDDGKPVRLEGIVSDVTEKKQTEQRRLDLEASRLESDRLRHVNEFKTQFLNMVAHDLNNILTPLKLGLLSALKDAPPELSVTKGQAVAIVNRSVHRLTGFLADLLDAARLQSGQLKISAVPVDLAELVRTSVENARPQASEVGIHLEADIPEKASINGDARRLDQVLTNLLSNALKFTPTGGRIRVDLRTHKDAVEVSVTDTGRGVAPENLGKLFEPFSRITPAAQEKHTGTGLGLFVCRGIVEGHGGKITCESPGVDKGSTFRFVLPATAPL